MANKGVHNSKQSNRYSIMAKKAALIVRTEFVTRVVVDVPDDFDTETVNELFYGEKPIIPDNSETENQLVEETMEKIIKEMTDYHSIYPNITEVYNDVDNPFVEFE